MSSVRKNSTWLCLFSLLFAVGVQADISYELVHDIVSIGSVARAFAILVMIFVACALAFALEAASASLFALITALCVATAFFPSSWLASNEWTFKEIFAPIAVYFALGFIFMPNLFKKLSYSTYHR